MTISYDAHSTVSKGKTAWGEAGRGQGYTTCLTPKWRRKNLHNLVYCPLSCPVIRIDDIFGK